MFNTIKKYTPHFVKKIAKGLKLGMPERVYYKHSELIAEDTTAYSHSCIAKKMLAEVAIGSSILDVGCGCGYLAHLASEKGCKVTVLIILKKHLSSQKSIIREFLKIKFNILYLMLIIISHLKAKNLILFL